ncbi:MAG: hypothetical protein NW201_03750 [Gemmatimonadales bacterium]|nr:hypothetical protein [Gemmatimonadales bacterium]
MSDAPPAELTGVVVAHGELAAALVGSVDGITGLRGALIPVSNTGCDRDQLEARVLAAVGTGPCVVFVDMASGSCMFAVLRRLRAREDVRVVTGVNLAMLLDFVFHRGRSPADAAVAARRTGEAAITVA